MLTTYVLIIEKGGSSAVGVHERTIFMEEGLYLYVGSAKRGLRKRLARHLKKRKNRFWHVDYITCRRDASVRAIYLSPRAECETLITVSLLGTLFGSKLGSSDCRCRSHFVQVRESGIEALGIWLRSKGFIALAPPPCDPLPHSGDLTPA